MEKTSAEVAAAVDTAIKLREEAEEARTTLLERTRRAEDLLREAGSLEDEARKLKREAVEAQREAAQLRIEADSKAQDAATAEDLLKEKEDAQSAAKAKLEEAEAAFVNDRLPGAEDRNAKPRRDEEPSGSEDSYTDEEDDRRPPARGPR